MSPWLELGLDSFSNFVLRYGFLAGVAFVGVAYLRKMRSPPVQERPRARQIFREIALSSMSAAIFSAVATGLLWCWAHGYTQLYANVTSRGVPWLILSVLLMVLTHDAYFYWTHRWMHRFRVLWVSHRIHHRSVRPTPWAAFSFDPGEALIQAGILPLIVFTIPAHPAAIFVLTTIMTTTSVWIHCGYELYPAWLRNGRIGRFLMTATAHGAHHGGAAANFGLYFTFWNLALGTAQRQVPDVPCADVRAGDG